MSPSELRKHLWRLPASERCAMLTLSLVEEDPSSPAAELGLIRAAFKMGMRHVPHVRNMLAGNMRLNAHRLEQDRVPNATSIEANDVRAII